MRKGVFMNREAEKYQQIVKEARATGLFLLVLIVLWCVLGFGLVGVEGEIFALPVWAFFGTFGIWGIAIVGVKLLTSFVFKDMELSEEEKA